MGRSSVWGMALGVFLAGSIAAQDLGVMFDTTTTGIQTPRTLRMRLYPDQCDSVCVQFIEFTYDTLPSLYFEGPFCASPPNVGTFYFDIGDRPFPDDAHVVYTIYHNGTDTTNILNIDPLIPGQFYPFPEGPCDQTGMEEGSIIPADADLQVFYNARGEPVLRYSLPPQVTQARLSVYDLLGRVQMHVTGLSQHGEIPLNAFRHQKVVFIVMETEAWNLTKKVWIGRASR